ncbi:MAG TPA: hypothetical protein VKE22_30725 [Haliangiales bacterium]|nr:hypothetical protein [Haliangiales bacterium]
MRALAVLATIGLGAAARADGELSVGAGVGERGLAAIARLELCFGPALLALRGEHVFDDAAGGEATVLAGLHLGPVAAVAGARAGQGGLSPDTRAYALAGARWYYADSRTGDFVELSAVHIVAGRDRPYLKHEPLLPAWNLLVAHELGPIAITIEAGITGLERRDDTGDVRAEIYARAGLAWRLAW